MIRSLAIVTALCLFGTSTSATTMQECRAKYKAAEGKPRGRSGFGVPSKKGNAVTPRPVRAQTIPRP